MKYEIKGDGNPIVLVPGGLTGWLSWEPFTEAFAQTGTVIRVQLLGVEYGIKNQPLPDDYSLKKESEALAATLDTLGYSKPVDIVAWSYGGLTALDFALDNPDRIRTLTLIEPPALWVIYAAGFWNEEVQELADFNLSFTGDITEEMLVKFLVHAGFTQEGQSAKELPQWELWNSFRNSLRIVPYVVSHHDEANRLHQFQRPTLLVKGSGSTTIMHQIIDLLGEAIPQSKVVEFPGGHAPHIVSRDMFMKELEKFRSDNQ